MVIDGNRRWLKPYHEWAIESQDRDRELGMDKDLSKGQGLGLGNEEGKDQGMELTLEKGFDRGIGF